ncbi:Uncharacterized protein HZ326_0229 [Fusarium oxysporum f. sp. albedinis]|nr:Uncharacterized protein HZ326_0229 [Fusarium oxysporum f. sp. albedinis]
MYHQLRMKKKIEAISVFEVLVAQSVYAFWNRCPFCPDTPVLSIDFRNRAFQTACMVIRQDTVVESCWILGLLSVSTRHGPAAQLPGYPPLPSVKTL